MMTDAAYRPVPRGLPAAAPAADGRWPTGSDTRYRLSIARVPGGAAALEVHDNVRGCPLLGWQGDVARQVLDSGILPAEYCRAGCHGCDKSLVQRLIMAGAAAEMRIRAVEDAMH
jgi:hypothetical protein